MDFLEYLNNDFMNKTFNEWYFDGMFWSNQFNHSQIYNIFFKYRQLEYREKEIIVSEDDALFLTGLPKGNSVLVQFYIEYLISCCKSTYNKSHVLDYTNSFLDLFFANINMIDNGLPYHNFVEIMKRTIRKVPNSKNSLSVKIYDRLIHDSNWHVMSHLADNLFYNAETARIFSNDMVQNIFNIFLQHTKEDNSEFEYLYFFLKKLVLLIANFNKKQSEPFFEQLCRLSLINIKLFTNYSKQIELQFIRDEMTALKNSFSDEDFALLDSELETANKEALSHMIKIDYASDPKQTKIIQDQYQKNIDTFNKMSNDKKILDLICQTYPFSIERTKRIIQQPVSCLSMFANELVLDQDGRVINYKKLTDNELFSLKAKFSLNIDIQVYMQLLVFPFFQTFTLDDESKKFIRSIFENNKLVDRNKIDDLSKLFCQFFNKEFENSVGQIVLAFEDSVRFYLKNQGLNIIKTNQSGHKIDLNYVFNNYENNSFRDKLLETIDEDFYFTLKWLLCDEYGFNLRNNYAHGDVYGSSLRDITAIYAIFQIFRFYFGFMS